ncbi:pilus assembly protein PilA [Nocardioides aromaticivorans]|uniref:Pilus assembly protein PilA n=1 Tax=Nocardioides aromaticivorans TaxID=200618 RepID=A0ABX7PJ81_9ACTN|nr:prepilin-type N-terminal cleavage/methylation domain-containing protein [Nocardioides aromaticivorans]QSR25787.1 pilus assembly protein PilA [Nocardioides aromaticivorans]
MRRTIDRLQVARREDRGFTLIELLIVIIILGVLAAIVVFSVRGITDRGDKAACKANLSTLQTASEAYYAKNNAYAADAAALVSGGFLQSDPTAASVDAKIRASYTTGTPPTIGGGSSC